MTVEVSGTPKSKLFFIWILIGLGGYALWRFSPVIREEKMERRVGFTRMICDDAYQTEADHSKDTGMFFDVKLTPGCFSGYVTLPETWTVWQVQFRGYDRTDWYSKWLNGAPDPFEPIMIDKANGMRTDLSDTHGTMMMRLEGKGTLRFYDIVRRSPDD